MYGTRLTQEQQQGVCEEQIPGPAVPSHAAAYTRAHLFPDGESRRQKA